jgi:hypothetical protein
MEIQARGAMASAVDARRACSMFIGCYRWARMLAARRALSMGIQVADAMALAVAMMLHVRWFLSLGEAAVERRCATCMLHFHCFPSLIEWRRKGVNANVY